MSIPREFIDLLLTRIDLVDFINGFIPLQKKSGNNYFARCPFHQEKSASFSVSQQKQFYYCFGCGAHGNAIDFIMQHDHLPFLEAIEQVAKYVGIEVPNAPFVNIKKENRLNSLYELMNQTAAFYYDQMRTSPRAIEYLKNRGISGVIAQQFQLGYAPKGFQNLLPHLGKTEDDQKKLLEVGLIIKKNEGGYYDRFRDRIMFPIHDYRGRLIGFGGRILDQGEPKYLNSPETPLFQKGHELYGLHQILKVNRQIKQILIVEGYMDVIALFQHGLPYAVATLGTATTPQHLKTLMRYTSDIIFCFDGDAAGKKAALRALQVIFPLMDDSLQIRFLFLPDGEDPDSLIRREGKEAFENAIQSATSLSAFFFQTISQQCDMNTMEGRARLASLALNQIKLLPNNIFQGILLDELSKRTRIDLKELKSQIKNPEANFKIKKEITEPLTEQIPTPIRLATGLLLQYPTLMHLLNEELISDLPGLVFLNQLVEIIKKTPNLTTGTLLENLRGHIDEKLLGKYLKEVHMIPEMGVQNEFLGATRQIKSLIFDKEIDRLLAKAAQSGLLDNEKHELNNWINRKKALVN